MKIDRLIGILSILLQREKVTAPFLAKKFEVSKRTIHRDVENLCKAGIPIVTEQGVHGGISIMEGYKVDRTLLTSKELQAICTGLKSLDSITGSNKYQLLMDKLSLKSSNLITANQHVLIDLSSWNTKEIAPKIELIQSAIKECHFISFQYYAPSGTTKRSIEPYLLIFQWQSWYVWGYCTYRKEFRMFKLARMDDLMLTKETFEPRQIPNPEEVMNQEGISENLDVAALFDPSVKWRLIEELGAYHMEETPKGMYYVEFQWSDEQSLFRYLLSYMENVELVEPVELRDKYKRMLNHMMKRYIE